MGVVRHDGECVGVVCGPEWGLLDWECDGPDRPEFGLRPRAPRGQLELRRRGRALGLPERVRPGLPVLQPRLPSRLQFSSVSSKRRQRRLERSGCGAGVGSEWSERKTQA